MEIIKHVYISGSYLICGRCICAFRFVVHNLFVLLKIAHHTMVNLSCSVSLKKLASLQENL